MVTAKDCHTLTSYYLAKYQEKYGRKPTVNRNKARWGFDSILHDLTSKATIALLDYYFSSTSTNSHSLEWFFYNYETLIEKKKRYESDEADRQKLREASKKRVEEWRKRNSGDTRG